MKKIFCFFASLLVSAFLFADEGIWLPSQIADRIADMQAKGFKLAANDLYSINSASYKDAIVHFGGGCTGELISDKGLLITNHHCGFGAIQAHSSVEHDYLKDGFWAMNMSQELSNPGTLTVSFLERMDDVTKKVLNGCKASMSEAERAKIISQNSKALVKRAESEGKGIEAKVAPLFYGNQYFIFVYKVYSDIRLVGAPPSSIGKFGGDTDNWMWPRHTGDFSLFRIYADKNNEPADYSPDNVPFRPKKSFVISSNGVKEGDFTLVYGFPGRTQEYITHDALSYIADVSNPAKVKLRDMVLDIQNNAMKNDQRIRIAYASKNASIANSWKKWQGEMKGIKRLNAVNNKLKFEKDFSIWAAGTEYAYILDSLHKVYTDINDKMLAADYQKEAINAVEIIKFAGQDIKMPELFFKNYYQPIDKQVFIKLYSEYDKQINERYKSDYFKNQIYKYGSVEKWADVLFSEEFTVDGGGNIDMAKEIFNETNKYYNTNIYPDIQSANLKLSLFYRTYMKGLMAYYKEKKIKHDFYPDANSTLRIAYGNVKGYSPSDAVYYTPVSTLDGIMQKDNPQIYDYNIPQKLRDLYAAKDYGRWAVNGSVPVAFIATNHTSGGNSGSPVINANGELVGVNFDRVWEGTMSDEVYDPDVCRNISLDIRYALFIIDKLAGAQWLLKEMTIK